MIIKGNSRGGASQLGRHLLRADTNEIIKVLELQSPIDNLTDTLRDWQLLSTGTQGSKGLYPANISPAHYHMTPEQWLHSVEVLEKELGFEGQPRLTVLHQKPDADGIDREHIHVVWQRTDIDTMTLKTDSQNYAAHERASLALEMEFGHELVPDKHAKRDLQQQPEFPRSDATHAEKQQAERNGTDLKEFREHITALYRQSDTGQAFKAAVESQGLILAAGERGYAVIDEHGTIHNLARCTKDKTPLINQFMADVPLNTLPTVDQAKALQPDFAEERQRREREAAIQAKEQQRIAAETMAHIQEKDRKAQELEDQLRSYLNKWKPPPGIFPDPTQPQPDIPTVPQPHTPEPVKNDDLIKIETALKERHDKEILKLKAVQEAERSQTIEALDRDMVEKLEVLDATQEAACVIYDREHKAAQGIPSDIAGLLNPQKSIREAVERNRHHEQFLTDLMKERNDRIEYWNSVKADGLQDMTERHYQQHRELAARCQEEVTRYTREHDNAQKILAELEEQTRQQEHDRKPDEPESPKRSL